MEDLEKRAAEKRARIEAEIAAERRMVEEANHRSRIAAEVAAERTRKEAEDRKIRI